MRSHRLMSMVMSMAVALFAAASVSAADAPAAATASATPKVMGLSGVGLSVADIEASTKFYTEILGLKVALTVPNPKDPKKPLERVFSVDGKLAPPLIVVSKLSDKPLSPGKVDFGRILTSVPNQAAADAIIARGKAAGYKLREFTLENGMKGSFLTDPDGYGIELFPADRAPKPN